MRVSLILLAAVFASTARAQQPAPPAADSDYATSDVMIPMRDGVRLHTVIVTPKTATAPLPILMERTPYGTEGFAASVPQRAKRLGLDGYIHIEQDIRGRFGSEGAFDMNRPPHSGHAGTDESSDTYDTIDWLVKNVPNNNGRVGIFGISYPGWLTAVGGIGAHPADCGEPAGIRDPEDPHAAVVVRHVLHEPIDRVVGVAALVGTRMAGVGRTVHVEGSLGAEPAANVLLDVDVAVEAEPLRTPRDARREALGPVGRALHGIGSGAV